uniref:G patch domain-containing protein 11 n=1 Tax=Angiostrongylus cantonensis TaxID=6313 RepID=A0A0K0DCX2_ANGCA
MTMCDDQDDYMSDSYLCMTKDVKPGITSNPNQRRLLKIESHRMKCKQEKKIPPKMHELGRPISSAVLWVSILFSYDADILEKAVRDEGLNKPVPETSKGFALIAKMGYKPGMSLGKKQDGTTCSMYIYNRCTILLNERSGITEPIGLEVKACRSGLGHENEREKQAKLAIMQQMERMKRRAEHHVELIDDYRKRKRGLSNRKGLICDILTSRKICVELDLRLNEITFYLRTTYHYCIWCGCQFKDYDELIMDCPGKDREAHDAIDEG